MTIERRLNCFIFQLTSYEKEWENCKFMKYKTNQKIFTLKNQEYYKKTEKNVVDYLIMLRFFSLQLFMVIIYFYLIKIQLKIFHRIDYILSILNDICHIFGFNLINCLFCKLNITFLINYLKEYNTNIKNITFYPEF